VARYFAFLRAINVGGHTVTMARLRQLFEELGFDGVETFIASGNVIFSATSGSAAALERKIEKHLEDALGYEVKTFLRTRPELVALARHKAFPEVRVRAAKTRCVGFLAEPLDAAAKKALDALKTAIDDFHLNGREVYWLCKVGQSESKFSNVVFERAVKTRVTFRGANTVLKLAAKALGSA
jgi:uncharacterized protein (DUF1697 family)